MQVGWRLLAHHCYWLINGIDASSLLDCCIVLLLLFGDVPICRWIAMLSCADFNIDLTLALAMTLSSKRADQAVILSDGMDG